MGHIGFERLEQRLHVALPSFPRTRDGFGPYTTWVAPTRILDPRSGAAGGQMLPDALPLLGNGFGDVILARFAADGSLLELVEWLHEQCSWHPTDLVPGFASPAAAHECEAKSALDSGLGAYCREHGGAGLADALGMPWETLLRWLSDTDEIDAVSRARIQRETSLTAAVLFSQDWARAEAAATAASALRSDLAWPGALLGRAAERRGDVAAATGWYARSLRALQTTQSFTELWNDPGEPFAASRLREIGIVPPDDDHLRVCIDGNMLSVRAYWIKTGDRHLQDGRALQAYHCLMRAGWDWHFTDDMGLVLERLLSAAEAVNSAAWTELARLHLRTRARC